MRKQRSYAFCGVFAARCHRTSATRPPLARSAEPSRLWIPGLPTGTAGWRDEVAAAAAGLRLSDAIALDFVLRPGKWVDLDTLTESTARGLRDAGAVPPRYHGLDAIVATKRFASSAGVTVRRATDQERSGPPPGQVEIDAHDSVVPRPGNRDAKRAWREVLAVAWAHRPVLTGDVWADVSFVITGSLLGPLEVVLDALEPVLGRDPRGRTWQEFFPNDDRIVWLRVRRREQGPAVGLQLGMLAES